MNTHNTRRNLAGLMLLISTVGPALSAPEEIQVYRDEMEAPGHFGLDIHMNYVGSGRDELDDAALAPSLHRLRVTPEFSYGLSSTLSLGAYLPLATWNTDTGQAGVEGVKVRLKFLAPHKPDQQWYWGVNAEVGRVSSRLDPNPYNAELKGIFGGRTGHWSLAANLNIDLKVQGPQSSPTSFEITSKAEYALSESLAIGLESYNGLGEVHHLGEFSSSEHQTFLTLARKVGNFDVDLGVGSGYGSNTDRWILKLIVGVPLP